MIIKIIKKLTPLFIKNFLRRVQSFLTWDPWINYSYSQEGEDMVLKRIFENKIGFYIDVGAHHPKRFSNTYLFYKKGWKGINIDALPGSMKLFNKIRPRDINLEIGVAEAEDVLNYYVFNEPALNTFSEELSNGIIDKCKNQYFIKEVIKVKVKRLDKILDSYLHNNEIDFLNIDVEGLDYDVLKSNNWNKYRPKCVLVEILDSSLHNLNNHPIVNFMKQKDYCIYAKQMNTVFFMNNDNS